MQIRKLGAKMVKAQVDRKWSARVRFQAGFRVETSIFDVFAPTAKRACSKAMNRIGLSAIDADVIAQ